MPGYVTAEQVAQALRPSLGSAVLEQTGLCEGAARLLKRFAPYRETLEELAQRVESYLFDTLYGYLGDDMTVKTDSGELRRIRMRELPQLADDVMACSLTACRCIPSRIQSSRITPYTPVP